MMLTLKTASFSLRTLATILLLFVVLCCTPLLVLAQESPESQTLSISPTLFEVKANPGQVWQSELRIVNVNLYDLTVYPEIYNFEPQGEDGRGDFVPINTNETKNTTLGEWMKISSEAIVVPKQQTVTIPISVAVPADATPGGHYAAVLVGTKPTTNEPEGESSVQTAQFVTSLFFIRVAGDVIESGDIREFTTSHTIMEKAGTTFDLRFENKGNVHLRPQGNINVYNMWGNLRGEIPINYQTRFGNVLPNSVRKFSFDWQSNTSLFDIGRYKAVATVGYGDESKQFATSTTYFWVFPYKVILVVVVGFALAFYILSILVRRYVKRMIALSSDHRDYYYSKRVASSQKNTVVISRYQTVTAPVRVGVDDMINSWRNHDIFTHRLRSLVRSLYTYRLFFMGCLILVGVIVGIVIIIHRMTIDTVSYEVSVMHDGSAKTLSSEDVYFEKLAENNQNIVVSNITSSTIAITNRSGIPGTAAVQKLRLIEAGYAIESLTVDESTVENRTVIVFRPSALSTALELSKFFSGAPLSSVESDTALPIDIVIYVGRDAVEKQ